MRGCTELLSGCRKCQQNPQGEEDSAGACPCNLMYLLRLIGANPKYYSGFPLTSAQPLFISCLPSLTVATEADLCWHDKTPCAEHFFL